MNLLQVYLPARPALLLTASLLGKLGASAAFSLVCSGLY